MKLERKRKKELGYCLVWEGLELGTFNLVVCIKNQILVDGFNQLMDDPTVGGA